MAGRVAVVAAAVTAGSLLVLLIALTFEIKWGPALRVDNAARDDLHQYGLAHPQFTAFMQGVSAVSGAVGWQVVSVIAIAWLLLRRRFREAAFVLVANAGSSLLNTVLKDLIHRHRPVVTHPFLHAPGQSFPSGHAQAAATAFTVLLFVLWPHLHTHWMRRAMIGGAVAAILLIGYSRVALAAHFLRRRGRIHRRRRVDHFHRLCLACLAAPRVYDFRSVNYGGPRGHLAWAWCAGCPSRP
ncbi:hypothetical protein GCM10027517_21510 [Phycicoccus ginsengisoli]